MAEEYQYPLPQNSREWDEHPTLNRLVRQIHEAQVPFDNGEHNQRETDFNDFRSAVKRNPVFGSYIHSRYLAGDKPNLIHLPHLAEIANLANDYSMFNDHFHPSIPIDQMIHNIYKTTGDRSPRTNMLENITNMQPSIGHPSESSVLAPQRMSRYISYMQDSWYVAYYSRQR